MSLITRARASTFSLLVLAAVALSAAGPAPLADSPVATGRAHLVSATRHARRGPFAVFTKRAHTYYFRGHHVNERVWGVYDNPVTLPRLLSVSGSALHIRTTGGYGSGLCLCRSGRPSKPYGRWDFRIRAHPNADHGFAVMLWPNSGPWPRTGEIDVAEFNADRHLLYTTVHFGRSVQTVQRRITQTPGNFTRWHTIGVAWNSREIDWSVDGTIVMRVRDKQAIPHGAMHPALQAQPDSAHVSNTSSQLDVAWVRRYVAP